jgi:hypothetical protein
MQNTLTKNYTVTYQREVLAPVETFDPFSDEVGGRDALSRELYFEDGDTIGDCSREMGE